MRKAFAATTALWLMTTAGMAQAQQAPAPADDHVYTSNLMTRWGKDVTPDNAWRLYPRPQMKRDRWQNLNGLWDYAITPKGAAQPAQMDG